MAGGAEDQQALIIKVIMKAFLLSILLTCFSPALISAQSSGSVTISSVVAPVRYILVDNDGIVQQVVSNTSENVPPMVYVETFKAVPILPSTDVYKQYLTIAPKIKADQTGIVYVRSESRYRSLKGPWIHFMTLQSVLPLIRLGTS